MFGMYVHSNAWRLNTVTKIKLIPGFLKSRKCLKGFVGVEKQHLAQDIYRSRGCVIQISPFKNSVVE